MICGNGLWINQTYTGTALESILNNMVTGKMGILYPTFFRWSNGRLSTAVSTSTIQSMVNTVHTKYPNIKIIGRAISTGDNISNYTQRISDVLNLVQANNLDGFNDDIESFSGVSANGQNIIDYYNGMYNALHPVGKLTTLCRTNSGVDGSPYWDGTVYPALKVDLVIPMFYNLDNFSSSDLIYYIRKRLGQTQSPLSIGLSTSNLSAGLNGVASALSGINTSMLAGFTLWAYDYSNNQIMDSNRWSMWNNYTPKNITCGSTPPVLTTIAISGGVSLGIGATEKLTVICKDQNGNAMTCPAITWTSSITSIASVNSSGIVTGIAIGNTNITASAGGKTSNTITVTVTATPPTPVGTKTYTIINGNLKRTDGRTIDLSGGTITLQENP